MGVDKGIEIKIDDSQLQAILAGGEAKALEAINEAIFLLGLDAESLLKRGTPVSKGYNVKYLGGKGKDAKYKVWKKRGGSLRLSLNRGANDNIYKQDKQNLTLEIGTKIPYANSIIGDTDPYTIKAKKKYLMFATGPKPYPYPKGNIQFRKKVTHPGGKKITGEGTGKGLLSRVAGAIEKNGEKVLGNVFKRRGIY